MSQIVIKSQAAGIFNAPAAASGYEYVIKVNQEEILLFNSTIEEAQAGNGIAYSPKQLEISVEKRVNNNFTTVQINPKNLRISYLEASTNKKSLELVQFYYEDGNYSIAFNINGDNFSEYKGSLYYKNGPGNYSQVGDNDEYDSETAYYQKKEENSFYTISGNILTFYYIEALGYPQDGFIKIEYFENDYSKENNSSSVTKIITIRPGLNQDMAKLALAANGIYASIQSSKLEFTGDGLKVHNGGLNITKDEYKEMPIDFVYESGKYYFLNNGSYELAKDDTKKEGITYYEKIPENQLDFNDGNLQITGIIHATDGDFTGTVHATDGEIDGYLTIGNTDDNYLILSNIEEASYIKTNIVDEEDFKKSDFYKLSETNEYIKAEEYEENIDYYTKVNYKRGIQSSNYLTDNSKGFYIDLYGNIIANNLTLGNMAKIENKLQVGDNCFIYNPDNQANETNNFIDIRLFEFREVENVSSENFYENKYYIQDQNSENGYSLATTFNSEDAYFVKELGNQSLFSLNNQGVIALKNNDGSNGLILNPKTVSISSNNFISGISGWHIDPNMAEFNNIAARGSLYASVFAYGEIQTIGGSVIVRPAAKIKNATNATEDGEYINIELETPTAGFEPGSYCSIKNKEILYQIVEDETQTLAEDEKSEEFVPVAFKIKKIPKSEGTQYLDTISMIGETIISFGIEDSSYTKITTPTENEFVSNKYYQYNINTDKYTLIKDYNSEIDYYIRSKINLKENISIAINASDSPANYAPNAISVFSTDFDEISSTEANFNFVNSAKIILGRMNGEKAYGGLTGYGLYADNVYLKGSLIAEQKENNQNIYYSGINTKNNVSWDKEGEPYNFFTSNGYKEMPIDFIYEPNKYYILINGSYVLDDGETKKEGITYYEQRKVGPILLWAGAEDEESIQKSPFLLDAYGNFYAGSGYFKGAILTESTIEAARIKTAVIEGTGSKSGDESSIGLKIVNVPNAISFGAEIGNKYTSYADLNTSGFSLSEISLKIEHTKNGLTHIDGGTINTKKIEFSNSNFDETISTQIANSIFQSIHKKDSKYTYSTISYDDNNYIKIQINNNNTSGNNFVALFETEKVNFYKDALFNSNATISNSLFLSNKMQYKQAKNNDDKIIGYDLYVSQDEQS